MKYVVLNLEWSSAGRDRNSASMICHGLRRLGCHTIEESIFDYRYQVHRHKPDLVLIADPVGASINQQASAYIHSLGIPLVTHMAEGNLREEFVQSSAFWGHRRQNEIAEEIVLTWSLRARDLIKKYHPTNWNRFVVSGPAAFDQYGRLDLGTTSPPKKHGVVRVGYAGWAFDKFRADDPRHVQMRQRFGEQIYKQLQQEKDNVRHLLKQTIEACPDVEFLLRPHPGSLSISHSEFAGLDKYSNVFIQDKNTSILPVLSSCDLWLAYESTTCLEAWLSGVPTTLLNPQNVAFSRNRIAQGSPSIRSADALIDQINCLGQGNPPYSADAFQDKRRAIIEDIIQWSDGKNHLRAAHIIYQILIRRKPHSRRPSVFNVLGLREHVLRAVVDLGASAILPTSIRKRYSRFRKYEIRDLQKSIEKSSALNDLKLDETDLDQLTRFNQE